MKLSFKFMAAAAAIPALFGSAGCADEDPSPVATATAEATTTQTASATSIATLTESAEPGSPTVDVAGAMVSTLAGDTSPEAIGEPGYRDGPADEARFGELGGIAVGPDGELYVADPMNNVIRLVAPDGTVSTYAGTGDEGHADGPKNSATFRGPVNVAVDSAGNVYVADALNHRIRMIGVEGNVSTVAGGGDSGMGAGSFADGPATEARFRLPKGIAVAENGDIYVADTDNRRVRVIRDGVVSTVAGSGQIGSEDGPGDVATFGPLGGIALSENGDLYIADQAMSLIRKIDPQGAVTTVLSGDAVSHPFDLEVTSQGELIIADTTGQRIVLLEADGTTSVMAGNGTQGFAEGSALSAEFSNPAGIALLDGGSVAIADATNGLVRVLEDWR